MRRILGPAVLVLALVLVAGRLARAELPDKDWQKVAAAAEMASRNKDVKGAAASFAEIAKDDSARAAKLICTVFGRFPGANDSDALYDPTWAAVDKLRSAAAAAELRGQLAVAKDWRLRVLLVDALGARGKGEQDGLVKALEDKQEEVVRAATRQLARFRTEVAIKALCDAMTRLESKSKTAATWQDMRNALSRALGVDLQGGADYKNFLEANRARFVEGRGIPPEPKKAGGGEGGGGGGGRIGETVVFGTELYCKSVVLIIDRSGSMEMTDPYPPGMDLGSFDRQHVASNGMTDPDRKRIVRARKELAKLVEQIAKAKGKINIISYSTQVECWKPEGLHDLGGANLASAKAFVADLKADGVTATEDALAIAFEVAPQADCFYLFSDGKATNDGQVFIPAAQIISTVERLNRVRKVQVNTFGFIPPQGVEGADVELMSGLAAKTGGSYTEIR